MPHSGGAGMLAITVLGIMLVGGAVIYAVLTSGAGSASRREATKHPKDPESV